MMILLRQSFENCVRGSVTKHDQAGASGSDTDADSLDSLTFDYKDDPFQSFMRGVEVVADTNPQEAVNMAKTALADKVFDTPKQLKKLEDKLQELLEVTMDDRTLGMEFTKRTLNMDTDTALENNAIERTVDLILRRRLGFAA